MFWKYLTGVFFPLVLSQSFFLKKKKGIVKFYNFTTLEENLGEGRNFHFIQKDISLQIKF